MANSDCALDRGAPAVEDDEGSVGGGDGALDGDTETVCILHAFIKTNATFYLLFNGVKSLLDLRKLGMHQIVDFTIRPDNG